MLMLKGEKKNRTIGMIHKYTLRIKRTKMERGHNFLLFVCCCSSVVDILTNNSI